MVVVHDPIADAKAQEATQKFAIRNAQMEDIPALKKMIEESLRALGQGYYTQAELDGSIGFLFGPGTQRPKWGSSQGRNYTNIICCILDTLLIHDQ